MTIEMTADLIDTLRTAYSTSIKIKDGTGTLEIFDRPSAKGPAQSVETRTGMGYEITNTISRAVRQYVDLIAERGWYAVIPAERLRTLLDALQPGDQVELECQGHVTHLLNGAGATGVWEIRAVRLGENWQSYRVWTLGITA